MIRVILTRPPIRARIGGVTIYLKNLLKNIDSKRFNIVDRKIYLNKFERSKETIKYENIIIKLLIIIYPLIFIYKLIFKKIDVVHSNPSLLFNAIIREAILIILSSVFKKKIVVFFHGWNENLRKKIEENKFIKKLFVSVFNKADAICVLSSDFKKVLEKWGINSNIYIEKTMVSNQLVEKFNFLESYKKRKNEPYNLLFLSRIEINKGIYEAIRVFLILRERNINVRLIVAGDGIDANEVKKYIIDNEISNVDLIGYVEGDYKIKVFKNSYAFIFPTQHGEGMPISVLEAIAFGLPVLTRYVGGLKDIFENEKHGFITNSTDPRVFADYLEEIIKSQKSYKAVSYYNYNYGQENLMASIATKRIETIYGNIL